MFVLYTEFTERAVAYLGYGSQGMNAVARWTRVQKINRKMLQQNNFYSEIIDKLNNDTVSLKIKNSIGSITQRM